MDFADGSEKLTVADIIRPLGDQLKAYSKGNEAYFNESESRLKRGAFMKR
jgi:hypothetical protein